MIRKITALTALCAVLALFSHGAFAQEDNAKTYRNLELFGTVVDRILKDYVEPVDEEKLIEAAIDGMLTSLDPHSDFLNAKEMDQMNVRTKGEFGGLGIEVDMQDGWVRVVSPIDDTPAFRAGLKSGDLITHIDGETVNGMSLGEAVKRMRGPVNTDIRLTIYRKGRDAFDVTITRAVIKINPVKARLEGDVGYLRLSQFNEQSGENLVKALQDTATEGGSKIKGYVLDLRDNPGGLLSQAIAVADVFIPQGEIVSTRPRETDQIQRFNAHEGDLIEGKPLVVLINDGSASASEIVAGALQDHKRAILLGTKSFGKGSVQTIMPLPGGVAMKMTTSRYYTPSGRSIQGIGIEPDILVEAARVVPVEAGGPPQAEANYRNALSNGNATEPQNGDQTDAPPAGPAGPDGTEVKPGADDYQLQRALDLIRGLALYSSANQ